MEYPCTLMRGKRKETWTATIHLLNRSEQSCEIEITGRGTYFHLIVGQHRYGNYLCIPNHDVGCELSFHQDVFWNTERLSSLIKKVDAVTVAYGLSHLEELSEAADTFTI